MITTEFAEKFAQEWVSSWNSHDLDRILSHYTEDCEINSPFIVTLMKETSGALKGKESVRAYWAKGLQLIPDLNFELIEVLIGVDSITIYYNAVFGKHAAEVLFFDDNFKVHRSVVHYKL